MSEKKIPEPFEALIVIILSFFIIVVITFIFSFSLSSGDIKGISEDNIELFYLISGIFFIIIPFIYAKRKEYDIKQLFRFNMINKDIIYLSVITGISLTIISDELDRLIQLILPVPDWIAEQLQYLIADSPFEWIIIILGAIIIAAFSEELLFRGFLQVSLEKKGDATRAVILSSIAWTIIHMNPYWAIQIFIMGIIIGFLAWRTNSVIPCMIVHGINNTFALLFLNFDLEQNLKWYLISGHVHPILLLISIYGLIWSIRTISNLYYRI